MYRLLHTVPYLHTHTSLRRPLQRPPHPRILKASHLKVIRELKLSLWVPLERNKVDNEGVFDGEDGIIVEVVAVAVEDLRNDGFVVWGCELLRVLVVLLRQGGGEVGSVSVSSRVMCSTYHEVDVCWSHCMSV